MMNKLLSLVMGAMVHIKLHTSKNNFDVCNVDLVQFIIQTNKCTTHTHTHTHTHIRIYTHINYILYILSTPTRFNASVSFLRSLDLVLC